MATARTALLVAILSAGVGAGAGGVWRMNTGQTSDAAVEPDGPRQAPPETLDAVLATAERAMLDSEPSKAAAVLEAAVADYPEDRVLWLALARTRTRLADGALSAHEAYEAALALGSGMAEDEFEAGTAANRAGLPERAIEHYRAAEAADPTDARFPLYAAQVLMGLDRPDEARASLFRATQLDEHLAIAWGSLAELALRENRPGVALQYLAKAREQQPRVTAWRVIEARARNRLNEPAEALAALEGVGEEDRLSLPVVRLYATSAAMLGNNEEAAARFLEAAQRYSTDGRVWLEAATWLERAGDNAGAIRAAMHAGMLGEDRAREMVDRLRGLP